MSWRKKVIWSYSYDVSGRLVGLVGSDGTQAKYAYDFATNTLNRLTVSQNGAILSDVSYYYSEDGRPIEALLHSMNGAVLSYGFDGLNRLLYSNLHVGDAVSLERNYHFLGTDNSAADLVEQLQVRLWGEAGAVTLRDDAAEFDDLGNIRSITDMDGYVTRFTYDGLNRLVREDNQRVGQTVVFTYDVGGNILRAALHAFSLDDTLGPVLQTNEYAYENPSWPDQLTRHNGNVITYDAMGNPLTYNGFTFTWQKGRQLAGIHGRGLDIRFRYNADGRRTQKIVNGVATNYTWIDGLLMRRQTGDEILDFAYDANGRAIGFSFAGGHYFYIYNLLGDVVAVVDAQGNVVAEYEYDAYGNLLRQHGPMAQRNPLRYRGYYFDVETGFYYLHNRYYNPQWARFLNADSYLIAGNALTASNLYQYANGNPVMFVDHTGEFARLREALQRLRSRVVNAASRLFSREERPERPGFLSGAREWTQNLRDRVGSIGQNIRDRVSNAFARPRTTMANVFDGIRQSINSLVSGIGTAIRGAVGGLRGERGCIFSPSEEGCSSSIIISGFALNPGAWVRGFMYSLGLFSIFLGISTRGWHSSVAEAARAFRDFLVANRPTRSIREYSGIIYARNIGSGYTFSGPLQGVATCSLAWPILPTSRAGIHSHPASEIFTDPYDLDWATNRGMPMFLVTESDRLLMVTPQRVISIVYCPTPNCRVGARCNICRANPPF